MIDLVIARSDGLDDSAFRLLRDTVPSERQRKSDGFYRKTDQYASVVSFSLLQFLWRERTSDSMPEIVLGTFGKPRFHDPHEWHFNWSHEASVCVCVLSPVPVGVDVQSRLPFDEDFFERIAAPSEHTLRDGLREADDLSALWTRKEALVKRTGRGLLTPLQSVDTVATMDIHTFVDDESGFRISVSVEGMSVQAIRSYTRIRNLQPSTPPHMWSEISATSNR